MRQGVLIELRDTGHFDTDEYTPFQHAMRAIVGACNAMRKDIEDRSK